MKNRHLGLVLLLFLLAFALSACGGDDLAPSTDVEVTIAGWEIIVAPDIAQAGEVAFTVANSMAEAHEFIVVKSDLPPAQLPVEGDRVDEAAIYITDQLPPLEAGSTGQLELELTPGKYVLICNLPGHYEEGMYASFLVEP